MPKVNGVHYPYTSDGINEAKLAKRGFKYKEKDFVEKVKKGVKKWINVDGGKMRV